MWLYSPSEISERMQDVNITQMCWAIGVNRHILHKLKKGGEHDYRLSVIIAVTQYLKDLECQPNQHVMSTAHTPRKIEPRRKGIRLSRFPF